jgi:Flp pilus assembly pilin Flp
MLRHIAKLLKRKRGAAAIEFALVAPILFLLLLGILEFGLTIFIDSTMHQALRAVARQGIVKAQTEADIRAVMQTYMQGLWRDNSELKVCVRALPNIVNVSEPKDANGNRLPGPASIAVEPKLAAFVADPDSMFGCTDVPSKQDQRNAVMLYTAEYQWGGKTKMFQALIPETLRAVTMVRNEF